MPTFNGTDGDDIFTGGAEGDTASGNGGNDTLSGAGGNDLLVGGAGSDTLNGGDDNDTLYSYTIDPSFPHPGYLSPGISYDIYAEPDILNGGNGDDYIFAGYGDSVDGGAGGSYGDRLYISFMGATSGVSADFRLVQSTGSIVIGGATITNIENMGYLEGSNYDDFLVPIDTYYPSGHSVYGRGGDDHIIADYYSGWGGGALYGDEGNDILDGRPAQYGPSLYGGSGDDTLYTSTNGFSRAFGGDGNDLIYSHGETWGGAGNDTIVLSFTYYAGPVRGEEGDDTITAAEQGNSISGGAGADIINGNAGNDQLGSADFGTAPVTFANDMGLEQDVIAGFGGNDFIAAGYGDSVDGGSGSDVLRYSLGGLGSGITFSTAAIVSGQPALIGGGTIQNIETLEYLRGTEFADNITAVTQGSLLTIDAGAGDDTITSQNSSVDVRGGDGNDRLISGAAGDLFNGGAGSDTIDYQNAAGGVVVNLATGTGAGGDQLTDVENVVGTALNDTLTGNASSNQLEGGAGNDILDGGTGADVMAGGAGDDSYAIDNFGDVIAESESNGNDIAVTTVSYALGAGVHLETLQAATGAGAISLTGNALNQNLSGNGAANVLEGGGGNDVIDGGDGYDTASYAGAAAAVGVSLANFGAQDTGGAGIDTLLNIENLTGSAFNDTLIGNAGANVISGGGGNDLINGGAGADTMIGGTGNDVFYIDNAFDQLTELANQGDDIAFVIGTYTLAQGSSIETLYALNQASTEALVLTGNEYGQSIYGNLGDNYLNGGQGNDYLVGSGGNDNLLGGTGSDHMAGGTGNDTYYVDNQGDFITELNGEGEDIVVLTASWRLTEGAYVETMSADANAGGITLTGNDLGQSLYGNGGDNVLIGNGGSDYMVGGAGNDRYYVDTSDYIGEAIGGGDDTIFVATSYALIDGNEIETLVAVNQESTTRVDFSGNEFGQSLYGSAGDNNLFGNGGDDYLVGLGGNDFLNGGTGNDNLAGGLGDDRYYVDAGDKIFEGSGEGDDLAVAVESFSLNAGAHLETLAAAEGTTAIDLTGNEVGQSIYGNGGANVLNGGGGNDYLIGGAGNDRFVFSANPGNDTIADFASGADKIDLTAFGITQSDVSATTANGTTTLAVDTNHDGTADFTITLVNANAPVAADYLF